VPDVKRAAVFGGVYSNHHALAAVLADARRRGAQAMYCLGDIGGFGPNPDRSFPLLREAGVQTVQGNYDHSVGHELDDCACGYTDPRDNHFAQISYDYTLANTSADNRAWLRGLPPELRVTWAGRRVLMAHGSPRRVNEFLWESTSPDRFLLGLLEQHAADVLLVTHTGLHWVRELPGRRMVINVGAIGRPANDGDPRMWYTLVEWNDDEQAFAVEQVPVAYDHLALAAEMRDEGLPEEFVETILSGWWTTCLEILPARERARGRY
jgi:diadenosine tetraphosphatase ApaH/serine/threonine PP2A family protein phosphatase